VIEDLLSVSQKKIKNKIKRKEEDLLSYKILTEKERSLNNKKAITNNQ